MTRIARTFLLGLFLGSILAAPAYAATYTAASCAESDVAAAVGHAVVGDTVNIPSCPSGVSWTTTLTLNVAITLIGQGPGNTVLIDNVPKGNSSCSGAAPMFLINPTGTQPWRLGEFTLQGSAPDTYICQAGHISTAGGSHAFRIDDINITNQQTVGIRTSGDLWGVIDHNTFNASHKNGVLVEHNGWGNVGNYGDNSWAQPDTLGTQEAIYIETNIFNDSSAVGAGCFDALAGARLVFRYNQCSFIASHDTASGGRWRGIRQYEVYNNTFNDHGETINTVWEGRGGTGTYFNNSVTGNYNSLEAILNYRDSDAFSPWGPSNAPGACDGTGPFDANAGTIYASGTYNGSSGISNVMTDTTKNWSGNQWVGYAIRNVTKGWGSTIASSTSDTITNMSSNYGQVRSWNSGDAYQVLKVYPCMDQTGRGPGVLLSGDSPGPIGPVNEVSDPAYIWGNSQDGSPNSTVAVLSPHIQSNRDYYIDGSGGGVSSGTYSQLPHTCNSGQGFWATDKNTLYQCSSANTWVAYYSPYTYPHPLTLGGGDPPAPPSNLQASPQ